MSALLYRFLNSVVYTFNFRIDSCPELLVKQAVGLCFPHNRAPITAGQTICAPFQ